MAFVPGGQNAEVEQAVDYPYVYSAVSRRTSQIWATSATGLTAG